MFTQALERGIFAEEIIPIEVRGTTIAADDTTRPGVTLEGLSALKPVFPDWGSATTAGNASGIGDGAAICILTTREHAQQEGMEILGKWVGSAVVGVVDLTVRAIDVSDRHTQVLSQGIWASAP